ncbi:amino acid ABC transporter permease [Terrihabitans sp. B22-R8]|uniref:amino acid ABC transporter permease n=1 Tax=Terrihabitans sp. B22-R8 TaxID=3425128 RepID=UPI00403C3658
MFGLDYSWLSDPTYQNWLLVGVWTTIKLAFVSSLFALIIGIACAFLMTLKIAPLSAAITFFVEVFRNTPPLLQMLFFYFTLSSIGLSYTDAETGVKMPLLDAFSCGAVSLSLFGGALCIEAFRSGLEAVPRTTLEAARSLGYGRFALLRSIQLPIAFRVCLAPLSNILINQFKTTSQASIIAVPELMYAAGQIYNDTFRTFEVMLLVLIIYVSLVSLLAAVLRRSEGWMSYPGYGNA